MTDIVDKLHSSYKNPDHGVVVVSPRLLREAADEIERLRLVVGQPSI